MRLLLLHHPAPTRLYSPSLHDALPIFPLAPIMIGVILGPLAESSFRNALLSSGGDYSILVGSPIAIGMYTLIDRKSTRLNSSHVAISYAVFCLKKKIASELTLDSHT